MLCLVLVPGLGDLGFGEVDARGLAMMQCCVLRMRSMSGIDGDGRESGGVSETLSEVRLVMVGLRRQSAGTWARGG